MLLPREKGSSTHDVADAECKARAATDSIVENASCPVCVSAVKEQARYFLDLSSRELGS